MVAFGGYGGFPKAFGGGPSDHELEHLAILDALAPGWDTSYDTAIWAETYAQAIAVTAIWAVNGRLANQLVPTRMMETLPTWEQATGLRPGPSDSAPARRRALAAKMLGFIGNTVSRLYDQIAALAGAAFVGFKAIDPATLTVYIPGLYPGPPGFEWSSKKASFTALIDRTGLSDGDYYDLLRRVNALLDAASPVWMTFVTGTDSLGGLGFQLDVDHMDFNIFDV